MDSCDLCDDDRLDEMRSDGSRGGCDGPAWTDGSRMMRAPDIERGGADTLSKLLGILSRFDGLWLRDGDTTGTGGGGGLRIGR